MKNPRSAFAAFGRISGQENKMADCAYCGGIHYGTPPGKCVFICETCGGDMRLQAEVYGYTQCTCLTHPQITPKPGYKHEHVIHTCTQCYENRKLAKLRSDNDRLADEVRMLLEKNPSIRLDGYR